MSVLLGGDFLADGRRPEDALAGLERFALAAIPAGLARERGMKVVRTPTVREPHHASVVGRKTKSVQKVFSRATVWVVPPADDLG